MVLCTLKSTPYYEQKDGRREKQDLEKKEETDARREGESYQMSKASIEVSEAQSSEEKEEVGGVCRCVHIHHVNRDQIRNSDGMKESDRKAK